MYKVEWKNVFRREVNDNIRASSTLIVKKMAINSIYSFDISIFVV
ncbi:MAG: hypothetical protein WCQ41_03935 [Bacillota bacterium]